MSDAPADLVPAREDEAIGSAGQEPIVRRSAGAAASWWIMSLFWLAALGYIGFTAANFRAVAIAADRVEEFSRLAPSNQAGRGACAAFARTQPPAMFDPDSECWINLTQQQYRDGTIRPHDFPFDNAPYGRARHWSSSFSWWLLLLAALTHACSGLPVEMAIAQVAPWANPVLFAGFVMALALVLRPKIGAWATGMFILTLAAMSGVEWDFSSGHPDHHGLHLMAFTGLFLGALLGRMGWVRTDRGEALPEREPWPGASTRRGARFWFTASGVCGGIGLWIGSVQQMFCIGVLGIGAVLGALCFARRWSQPENSRFEPELWRHWSRAGALTSLGFYLLEYFPSHLEMRLEVNHPMVALAWAGAGELMWIITRAKVDLTAIRAGGRTMLVRAILGLAAVAALPLAIVFGPRSWFVVRNPVFRWAAGMISEGQPWLDPRHPLAALHRIFNDTGVLLLAVPLAAVLLLVARRRLMPSHRGALLTLLLASGAFLGWTLLQSRWMGFLEISLVLLTLVTVAGLPVGRHAGAVRTLLWLAFLAPGWVGFAAVQIGTRHETPARHARAVLAGMMCTKEAAWNLELYSRGGRPARVMAPPGSSPTLHYYGGVETVGSYYWENLDGLLATIDFYNDTADDNAARRIARERGLDFVMAVADPSFVLELQTLKAGKVDVAAARRTLAFRLSSPSGARVPDWLERLPLLDAPMAQAEGIRLYRVRKDRLGK
jgi:hypothetical protein